MPIRLLRDIEVLRRERHVRGRLDILLLVGLAFACTGCVFPWTMHHLARPSQGKVILVRGLMGYWPGAVHLKRQLRHCGFDATNVVIGWEVGSVACALEENARCGVPQEPIVIVGYSLGANDAIKLCRMLDDAGIPVASLVLIECPYHDTIPPNVARCLNIYESRPKTDWIPMFRGLPLRPECCETDFENFDVGCSELACAPWTHSHFTICGSHEIHDVIVDEIHDAVDEWDADESDCGFDFRDQDADRRYGPSAWFDGWSGDSGGDDMYEYDEYEEG